MSVVRRIAAAAGAAALVPGLALASAGVASAAPVTGSATGNASATGANFSSAHPITQRPIGAGVGSCPNFHVCFWVGANYSGQGWAIGGTLHRGEAIYFGEPWRDHTHSSFNKTTVPLLYRNGTTPLGTNLPGYGFADWRYAHVVDNVLVR